MNGIANKSKEYKSYLQGIPFASKGFFLIVFMLWKDQLTSPIRIHITIFSKYSKNLFELYINMT